MGGWQHLIEVFYSLTGGAGFAHHISDAPFERVIVEGQLLLNVLLGSSGGIRTVDDLSKAAQKHVRDLIGHTSAKELIVCFDYRANVTGAKAVEQKKRQATARKSLAAKKMSPLTDEECEEALTKPDSIIPNLERVRASTHGNDVLARAQNIIMEAVRKTEFVMPRVGEASGLMEARDQVEIMLVHDGIVEHGRQVQNAEGSWEWVPLSLDGTDSPAGIGEAEELCAHYALCEKKVLVRCSDTDIVAILSAGVRRTAVQQQRELWLVLYPGAALDSTFSPPVEDEKKRKNDYPRCIEMIEATRAFLTASKSHETLKNFADPLLTLLYVCSLGGSDNVPQLPRMTGAAWTKTLLNNPQTAQWLARSAVFGESPPGEQLFKRLRTFIDERVAENFVVHQFSSTIGGKAGEKWKTRFAAAKNVPLSSMVLAEWLEEMQSDVQSALEARQRDADKKHEKALSSYTVEEPETAPDGTLVSSKKKGPPKPTTCVAFMPLAYKEVQGRIRRAHWHLQKIINGIIPNGTPSYDAAAVDGLSIWGWDQEGNATDNIVPWSNDIQLF